MEISAGQVSAAAACFSAVATVAGLIIRSAFAERDAKIQGVKDTQKILFEKLDGQSMDLQHYKLHVAETYVNQAALEKLLVPIERRLETIEKDLRNGGK